MWHTKILSFLYTSAYFNRTKEAINRIKFAKRYIGINTLNIWCRFMWHTKVPDSTGWNPCNICWISPVYTQLLPQRTRANCTVDETEAISTNNQRFSYNDYSMFPSVFSVCASSYKTFDVTSQFTCVMSSVRFTWIPSWPTPQWWPITLMTKLINHTIATKIDKRCKKYLWLKYFEINSQKAN